MTQAWTRRPGSPGGPDNNDLFMVFESLPQHTFPSMLFSIHFQRFMFGGWVTGDRSNRCRSRITVAFGAFGPAGCLEQLDDAGTCGGACHCCGYGGRGGGACRGGDAGSGGHGGGGSGSGGGIGFLSGSMTCGCRCLKKCIVSCTHECFLWGFDFQIRLSTTLGSLSNQEALYLEAWYTRRPISINTLIL